MPSQWAYRASMRVLGRVLRMHAWGGRKSKQSNRIDKGAWSGLRRRRWHQHAHSCQGTWSDGKLEVRCCSLRFCVVSFRPGCFEQYGALSEFEPEAGITLHDPDMGRQIPEPWQFWRCLHSDWFYWAYVAQWHEVAILRKETSWGKRARSSSKTSPNPGSDVASKGPVGLDRRAPILTMRSSIWSLFVFTGQNPVCVSPVCGKVGSCRKLMDLCCLSATFFQPIWLVRHRQHQGL